MGGKGSGRKKKPLITAIRQMKVEVHKLNNKIYALHIEVERLASRLNYWLKKIQAREGIL